ncbi:hypothetical protein L916_09564 [Phytophthora nicotianae]|uniref:Uncharacterized protein n=1 Tax=Phytophthora nicotianae TaxID=4792 RepID=W2IZP2_PHYNI|nr:hypothetical protein L916_09564 [Phytophthora nicotianae]
MPSPSTSLSQSPSAGASPRSSSEPESAVQTASTPNPTALVDEVANPDQNADNDLDMEHTNTAPFTAQPAEDGDSESSLWDIIGDSHPKLDSYGDPSYDQESAESTSGFMSPARSTLTPTAPMTLAPSPVPSANLLPLYEDLLGEGALPQLPLLMHNQQPFSAFSSPSHYITFEARQDGDPFELSKPIVREDGLLIVGTEVTANLPPGEKNRIFVTNFLAPAGSQPPAHIMVEQEVRDIQWMGGQAAIVAIGKEIQLIQIAIGGPCRLQDAINSVHSDAIRELAVSPTSSSLVVSGGFDQTVVLTDLRNQGDPTAAAVIGKFDACDVVSSVRWSPEYSQVSWTTDGGDFQVADTRAPSSQLQVPFYNYLNAGTLGSLFTHEYLSSFYVTLGFERGHIAFVDLRMPRQTSCTSLVESNLTSVGEIRRSKSNKFAIFGLGGFSRASLNGAASSLEQITLHRRQACPSFKTSGDFSYERGVYLAVSDNGGVVSVYTDDTVFGSSGAFNGGNAVW